jgi:hypothetical protein
MAAAPTAAVSPSTYEHYVGIDIDLNVGNTRHPTSTSVIPILETNMSD